MSKVKKINRILLIFSITSALLLGMLVIAGWYYVISMSKQANTIATETKNMKGESEQLAVLAGQYNKVLPKKKIVMDALPSEKEISVFLADFESLAKNDGLTIVSSGIGDTKTKSKGNYSQTISKDNYLELPIRYQISGTFTDFSKFIVDTSSLRRINTISDLSISSDGTDKAVDKIKATFSISIYLKQEQL